MDVQVAVGANRHGLMSVGVVSIVVAMRMLVLEESVLVLVRMVFAQVQPHAEQH